MFSSSAFNAVSYDNRQEFTNFSCVQCGLWLKTVEVGLMSNATLQLMKEFFTYLGSATRQHMKGK
jgi:predicted molibdopterin-dependent oxidoreductase YjgC